MDVLLNSFQLHGLLGESIPARYLHSAAGQIACAHGKAYRNSLELPLGKFETRAEGVAVIDFYTVSESLEPGLDFFEFGNHRIMLFGSAVDRNHHNLYRCESRRQHESVVVSVSHDQSSHKTGADSP